MYSDIVNYVQDNIKIPKRAFDDIIRKEINRINKFYEVVIDLNKETIHKNNFGEIHVKDVTLKHK